MLNVGPLFSFSTFEQGGSVADLLRVLIVEDHQALARVLKEFVKHIFKTENCDVIVVAVADGEAALRELRANTYSHVLCDIEFPKGSAVQIHDALRDTQREVRFVANTGCLSRNADVTTLQDRGVTVLQKPYNMERLAEAFGLS